MQKPTDHYHYFHKETGEYWGSDIKPPSEHLIDYTHEYPPFRDWLTETLFWDGSQWHIEKIKYDD